MNSRSTFAASQLSEIVGPENVVEDPRQLASYAVDGKVPGAAAHPGTAQEIAELVRVAAAENLAIIPTGSKTKLGIGMPPARYDLAVDMTRLDRVISYDPGDLTLSVEPGISLLRLAEILAGRDQFLPLEMPFFERATVGGTLASGVDSPLRQAYGTPCDFVLGMEFVTGEGALAKSGGRVVKNVTGYDLHKLMLGAFGSLGIITRVNFKTFPLPRGAATFIASFLSIEAAAQFNLLARKSAVRWRSIEILSPAAISLLSAAFSSMLVRSASERSFFVVLRAAGNEAALLRAETELHLLTQKVREFSGNLLRMESAEEQRLCAAIREFPASINAAAAVATAKISCLPSDCAAVFRETEQLTKQNAVEAAHAFRGCGVCYCILVTKREASADLVACCKQLLAGAAKSNRAAFIPWCPLELKNELNVWGNPREDFSLMQRVKHAFDPRNIFAPGRLAGGL